ncbi:MAG: response regulator [Acidobacteriaceae bacterium]
MTSNGIQVLVVDDDPVTRRAYAELLSNWGFETRTAQNGLAALVEIHLAKPDILLSDLEMPGMNGYELLSIVRRLHPEMPLVAMSGGYTTDSVPAGVRADAFYAKGAGSCSRLRAILGEISGARLRMGRNVGAHVGFSAV